MPTAAPIINYSFFPFVLPPHLTLHKTFFTFSPNNWTYMLHVVFGNKVNKREQTMIKGLYVAFVFYFHCLLREVLLLGFIAY